MIWNTLFTIFRRGTGDSADYDWTDFMWERIKTGIIIGIIAVAVVFGNDLVFSCFYVILSAAMMYEISHAEKIDKYLLIYNILSAVVFSVGDIIYPERMAIYLAIYVIILFLLHIFNYDKISFNDVAYSVFSFTYIQILFSYVRNVKVLSGSIGFLFFLASVVFSDIFAYFFGMAFGKHKLCPKISPKKTVEGSVGAFLGSLSAVLIFYFIYKHFKIGDINLGYALTYGLICGGVSQIGDLAASSIKRNFGIKDYSKILPGHGGILDRFDSILLVAPVFYLFMKYLMM